MKSLRKLVAITFLFAGMGSQTFGAVVEKSPERGSFMDSVATNVRKALPLGAYGLLAATAGHNLAHAANADQLYTIPRVGASPHWFWTAGLFAYSTAAKLQEVTRDQWGRVLGETAINGAFTGAVFAAGFYSGAPVGMAFAAAFVVSRILSAGDNSPLDYVSPQAKTPT